MPKAVRYSLILIAAWAAPAYCFDDPPVRNFNFNVTIDENAVEAVAGLEGEGQTLFAHVLPETLAEIQRNSSDLCRTVTQLETYLQSNPKLSEVRANRVNLSQRSTVRDVAIHGVHIWGEMADGEQTWCLVGTDPNEKDLGRDERCKRFCGTTAAQLMGHRESRMGHSVNRRTPARFESVGRAEKAVEGEVPVSSGTQSVKSRSKNVKSTDAG